MSRVYRLVHAETGATLLNNVEFASTPLSLALGLLGSDESRTSLWLPHTSIIHTFGMRYALDCVFMTSAGVVLRIDLAVRPGRVLAGPFRARAVIETKSFAPSILSDVEPGDTIRLE